jgi:hypothetical protein
MPYDHAIGTELVYRNFSEEEMKNHPKYGIVQKLCENEQVIDMRDCEPVDIDSPEENVDANPCPFQIAADSISSFLRKNEDEAIEFMETGKVGRTLEPGMNSLTDKEFEMIQKLRIEEMENGNTTNT